MAESTDKSLAQLKEVTGVLDQSGIGYWLDSGTLLGLVREQQLLVHDHDIDISIWWDAGHDFAELRKRFMELGYRIRPGIYQGRLFKFWLEPLEPSESQARSVDLRIFRVAGQYAWSPRIERRDLFHSHVKPVRKTAEFMLKVVWWGWKHGLRGWAPEFSVPLIRSMALLHCWWVPADFFEELTELEHGFSVPKRYVEYLQFRYGNWQYPVPDWDFIRDDPSYKHSRPEELFPLSASILRGGTVP